MLGLLESKLGFSKTTGGCGSGFDLV